MNLHEPRASIPAQAFEKCDLGHAIACATNTAIRSVASVYMMWYPIHRLRRFEYEQARRTDGGGHVDTRRGI